MDIDQAIKIADEATSDILSEEAWAEFAQQVEASIEAAITSLEEQDEEALPELIKASYRDLITKYFIAGIIWRDSQKDAESDEGSTFTVLVDTVDFVSSVIKNGSLSVRFVMSEKEEE